MRLGKSFDTTYIPKQTLEDINAKEASPWERFGAQIALEILTNKQWAYTTANLNDSFPEIQPMGVEEFVKRWWGADRGERI